MATHIFEASRNDEVRDTATVDCGKYLGLAVGHEHFLVFRPEVEVTVAAPGPTYMKEIIVWIEIVASSVLPGDVIESGNRER
jgi:hypothetical protein